MQLQSGSSTILQFTNRSLKQNNNNTKQYQHNYFTKHWQVIQTSIKFFILQKASVNIVAFKKSLELLVLHNQINHIKEALKVLWMEIFQSILTSIEEQQSNPLIALIQHYKTIQDRLKIVFTLLKSYLSIQSQNKIDKINHFGKLIIHQRQTVEHEAFDILCQLILESPQRTVYEKQLMLLIEAFRNSSYSAQNVISEENCRTQVRVDLLIVKKIGLFRHLEAEFDQSSKDFYVQLSQEIPKNENFLHVVNQYLERQIDLNKIFQPEKNTVYYVQKQLIREYYDFILDNLLESIINNNQINSLKIFWKFTLRLKDDAMKKFCQKLKKIIVGMKKYFAYSHNSKDDVFKIIEFRQNLFSLTQKCFQKNRKISNLIYNTFEQVLYEEQKHYLHICLKNLLQQHEESHQTKIVLESQQAQHENSLSSFSQNPLFKLFRITPSKQNFIKEFENRFARWILTQGFLLKNLKVQQKMITQMKKQVGNNLMKKLDRMLNDVWRNDSIHYLTSAMSNGSLMKCLFLSNDWPIQINIVFNIPDELYNMLTTFEANFKTAIQNKQKSIKWISQMGTIQLSINGVQSLFSEIQTAIIMILDKSIRPLKKQQIQASLNICSMSSAVANFSSENYLDQILNNLIKNNILNFNKGPQTYDINDDNETPYKFQRVTEQKDANSIKRVDVEKDNNILIQAAIVKILKKRKTMQRSDISRFIEESIKNFKPTFEQTTKAFQKLQNSQFIEIDRSKGIISYVE